MFYFFEHLEHFIFVGHLGTPKHSPHSKGFEDTSTNSKSIPKSQTADGIFPEIEL